MAEDTNGDSGNRAYGCALRAVIAAVAFFALMTGLSVMYKRGHEKHLVKVRLTKVMSTLDPFKTALETNYHKTHKPVLITTVLTQANSGGSVTPDWAALGFEIMPKLPREISSLRLTSDDDIVVVLQGIGKDVDSTQVRAHAVRNAMGTTWTYSCTSKDSVLKHYFDC